MQVRILPAAPRGTVVAPPSKSVAHRAIICACLAEGTGVLRNIAYSMDIRATIGAMRALGAQITERENSLEIQGIPQLAKTAERLRLDCCESGSTLRFLIPLAAMLGREAVFTGRGRLLERPQTVYEALFREQKLLFSHTPEQITVQGGLRPGRFDLRGDISSQFITGLLFLLPLLLGDSEIHILPPFESRSYVELTLQTMAEFGVDGGRVERAPAPEAGGYSGGHILRIRGAQRYAACDTVIEGDYSQAAFWAVGGAVSGRVECHGLRRETRQGDAVIVELLRRCGCEPQALPDGWAFGASALTGCEIDLADCPDLGPILMVLAAYADGETVIRNAGRLRIKESDRAAVMAEELSKLGVAIRVEGDSITIGGQRIRAVPAEVRLNAHNDHRVAMSLAVFAACGQTAVRLDGAECVQKSYPDFWEELIRLGGSVEKITGEGSGCNG